MGNSYKHWTEEENAYLRAHIGEGVGAVAQALHRSESAVLQHADLLGFHRADIPNDDAKKRVNARISACHRKKYHEAREQGLCGKCRKRWAEAGHSKCRVCMLAFEKSRHRPGAQEALKLYKRNQKAERKAQGLCINCGKPLLPEELGVNTQCKRCRAQHMERTMVRRIRDRIHGIPRKY